MSIAARAFEGGFADPVLGTQAAFRAIMDAMANPCTVQAIGVAPEPPAPLLPETAAAILTLADADTLVWLDAALAHATAVRDWIKFHAGAPLTDEPAEAGFAVVADPLAMPPLATFAGGDPAYPDRSTTLILQVPTLVAGTQMLFEGPGIRGRQALAAGPLPADFREQWAANSAMFPCGVDLIFAGPGAIAGLPRTTRIVGGG